MSKLTIKHLKWIRVLGALIAVSSEVVFELLEKPGKLPNAHLSHFLVAAGFIIFCLSGAMIYDRKLAQKYAATRQF